VTDRNTLQRYLDEAPLHACIGDLSVAVEATVIRIDGELHPAAENGAGSGTAHGGALATLLDTALTFALIAQTDHDWTTSDLRLDYLRPIGIGPVHVEAWVVQTGRRMGRAEGRLTDGNDRECARAIGAFIPID
jgi:uncharacterized protein (TIGR00369 family)